MESLYDEEIVRYTNRFSFGLEVGGECQMDGMVEENGSSGPTNDPLATPTLPIATSVQSVIHANQQSVIQTATTGNLQPVLTKGNVILVSKPNSVIQTPQGQLQTLQVVEAGSDDSLSNEEDASTKKRRDILSRRPSYRKILNDLGGQSLPQYSYSPSCPFKSAKVESSGSDCDSNLDMIPAGTLQLTSQGEVQGLHTLSMANTTSTGGTIVYTTAQGQDTEFYVPGEIVVTQNATGLTSGSMAEDQQRKREMRLLKNREAARECRRKKKEYIKCLENRVAVLENQNKALIDELKSLKELYCQTKAE